MKKLLKGVIKGKEQEIKLKVKKRTKKIILRLC